jgi:hypothetical protein
MPHACSKERDHVPDRALLVVGPAEAAAQPLDAAGIPHNVDHRPHMNSYAHQMSSCVRAAMRSKRGSTPARLRASSRWRAIEDGP